MRKQEGIHDKPSLVDFCKYLNLAVGNAAGLLSKKELLTKAVEKLMSEARHVVGSAASSSSSGADAAVVKRFAQVLRVALTQQNPEERRSNLERDLDALSQRTSKDGKPSLVDICRFLTLQVGAASGGGLRKEDMVSIIVDKLIEQLPDTSAASSAPAMGFVVAFMFFFRLNFFPKATAKGSFQKSTTIKDCRSDGCLERLSSKTAEVITVYKDCHQRLPK